MAYTAPSIGSQGLTIPTYSDILADLLSQFKNIYGQNTYLGVDSADYQFISIIALKIADTMQAIQLAYNARSPLTAVGSDLDSVVKLNGMTRKVATYSTATVTITGTVGTTITNGVVRDVSGFTWNLPPTISIPSGGTIAVTATAATAGNVNAAIGQISIIATPTSGWTSVTNAAAATPGQPVETDSQLRARQALSVALPSLSMVAGTIAGLAATSGVTRYNVIENPTNAVDSFGTPAHSITAVVEGGTNTAVATAIFQNRSIGCLTNGTTVVTVTDPTTGFSMPISFYRPTATPIYVALNVHGFTNYTSATTTAIQNAIVNYLNSLAIGATVTVSGVYGAALAVMPNLATPLFSVQAVKIGTSPSPTGTTDITLAFNQTASGVSANVAITIV